MFIINWCRIGENRPAGVDARFPAAAHLWHARLRPWRLEMKGSKVWRGRRRSWFHGILAGDEHGFMGGIMMDYGPMAWRRWFFYAFKSYELRRRDETPWPTGGLKWGCPLCSNKGMVIWRDDGGISWGSYYWHLLKLDLWIHSKLLIGLWFFMGVFCWMTKTCRFQTSKHGHRWPSDWRRSTWWFSSTFDGCFSSTLQGFPTFFFDQQKLTSFCWPRGNPGQDNGWCFCMFFCDPKSSIRILCVSNKGCPSVVARAQNDWPHRIANSTSARIFNMLLSCDLLDHNIRSLSLFIYIYDYV